MFFVPHFITFSCRKMVKSQKCKMSCGCLVLWLSCLVLCCLVLWLYCLVLFVSCSVLALSRGCHVLYCVALPCLVISWPYPKLVLSCLYFFQARCLKSSIMAIQLKKINHGVGPSARCSNFLQNGATIARGVKVGQILSVSAFWPWPWSWSWSWSWSRSCLV
jgi:hypothetical protein